MTNKRLKKIRPQNPAAVLRSLHTVRCKNLLSLVGEGKDYATQNDLAHALQLTDGSYISQMVGPKPRRRFTEVVARRFEFRLGLASGWLDIER